MAVFRILILLLVCSCSSVGGDDITSSFMTRKGIYVQKTNWDMIRNSEMAIIYHSYSQISRDAEVDVKKFGKSLDGSHVVSIVDAGRWGADDDKKLASFGCELVAPDKGDVLYVFIPSFRRCAILFGVSDEMWRRYMFSLISVSTTDNNISTLDCIAQHEFVARKLAKDIGQIEYLNKYSIEIRNIIEWFGRNILPGDRSNAYMGSAAGIFDIVSGRCRKTL